MDLTGDIKPQTVKRLIKCTIGVNLTLILTLLIKAHFFW